MTMSTDAENLHPTVLVIGGLPCSGKSALAEELKRRLGWPLLAKDTIKEAMFNELGWKDREWSRRLSRASYAVMFACAKQFLDARASLVVEGNFRAAQHGVELALLLEHAPARCVQILCKAGFDVLMQRFVARAETGQRHPGHVDLKSLEEIGKELREGVFALPLSGQLLEFDTTTITDDARAAFAAHVARIVAT